MKNAFELYGHRVGYIDLLGFGYRVECPCGWRGRDGSIYPTQVEAERDGLAHMRQFKEVPMTLEERVQHLERMNLELLQAIMYVSEHTMPESWRDDIRKLWDECSTLVRKRQSGRG